MNTEKELIITINTVLGNNGFVRKKNRWYFHGKDLLVSLFLQKSQWANDYYINIDAYLGNYEKEKSYPHTYADFTTRLQNIVPENIPSKYSFSLEDKQETGLVFQEIHALLLKNIETLKSLGKLDSLKNLLVDHKNVLVSIKLQNILDTI